MNEKTNNRRMLKESLYVVICQYQSGAWGICDFVKNYPYTSTSYQIVRGYMKDLLDELRNHSDIWTKKRLAVRKLNLQ